MNVENRRKQKLIEVKLAMSKRYESRAKVSGSKPRAKTLLRHAKSYRQQATDLQAQLGQ
jgi:hypothetical protein